MKYEDFRNELKGSSKKEANRILEDESENFIKQLIKMLNSIGILPRYDITLHIRIILKDYKDSEHYCVSITSQDLDTSDSLWTAFKEFDFKYNIFELNAVVKFCEVSEGPHLYQEGWIKYLKNYLINDFKCTLHEESRNFIDLIAPTEWFE